MATSAANPQGDFATNTHGSDAQQDSAAAVTTATASVPAGDARPAHVSSPPPPYWAAQTRRESSWSVGSSLRARQQQHTINLQDNEEPSSESSRALWARHVSINEFILIGSKSGPSSLSSYVVWNCKIETLDGGPIHLRKRYSEFDRLRRDLVRTFPSAEGAIPPLPPKSVVYKFQDKFLEKRRAGLAYFLNCILLNPEFASSPVLKEFLFG